MLAEIILLSHVSKKNYSKRQKYDVITKIAEENMMANLKIDYIKQAMRTPERIITRKRLNYNSYAKRIASKS